MEILQKYFQSSANIEDIGENKLPPSHVLMTRLVINLKEMSAHSLIHSVRCWLVERPAGGVSWVKGDRKNRSLKQYHFNRNNELHLSLLRACDVCMPTGDTPPVSVWGYSRGDVFNTPVIFVNNSLNEWNYHYQSKIIIIIIIKVCFKDIWTLTRKQYYTSWNT